MPFFLKDLPTGQFVDYRRAINQEIIDVQKSLRGIHRRWNVDYWLSGAMYTLVDKRHCLESAKKLHKNNVQSRIINAEARHE